MRRDFIFKRVNEINPSADGFISSERTVYINIPNPVR